MFEWQTYEGEMVDIRQEAPSSMRKLLHRSIEWQIWKNGATNSSTKINIIQRVKMGYCMDETGAWTHGREKNWTNVQSA